MPFLNTYNKCKELPSCGLVFIFQDQPVPVPLKKVNLHVKVVDFVAQVTIEQDYVNTESFPIEVSYSYPIEESGAIIGFEARIDDHDIIGEVKEKAEAKAIYDQAMQDKNTAILLDETAPDIFSMKLGQLKAGAEALVKLTYIMELPVEHKAVRLTIPTTIAPRYIPPTDNSLAARDIANLTYNNGSRPKPPLAINIDTMMKGKIKSIKSPTHNLATNVKGANEHGQHIASSTLDDDDVAIMDRDLVVLIKSEDFDKPVVLVEKSEESKAVLVSLIPSFKLDDQPTELIFLVDRSGSMHGSSIQQAKDALQLFLHSMPANCHFNIWSFGSSFSSLFKSSQLYDDTSLAQAKAHVADIDANLGGTEIYAPLKAIYGQALLPGFARQIFLLTDGDVSNSEEVIKLVKSGTNTRLFALGLGSSASRHLVKGVARAGNGTATFATLTEDLRPKVMTMLKNALMPSLTDLQLIWNSDKPAKPQSTSSVRTLLGFNKQPDKEDGNDKVGVLFDGSRMLSFKMFGKDDTLDKVTITAQAPDGPLSVVVDITPECFLQGGKFIHQLAARRRIQDIEESAIFGPNTDEEQAEIKRLALQHGIASKYTSFVGVDKNTRKTLLESAMISCQVSQEVPYGFGAGAPMPMPMFMAASCNSMPAPPGMSMARNMSFGPVHKLRGGGSGGAEFMQESCLDASEALDAEELDSPVKEEAPNVQKDTLEALIDLQMANGRFKPGSAINHFTGLSDGDISDACPDNCPMEDWYTALAIAILEKKFASDKDLWDLVMTKAKKYLSSTHPGDFQAIMTFASASF